MGAVKDTNMIRLARIVDYTLIALVQVKENKMMV